jgi:putative tryptophan/tyrosine transport system substrate-binding protein
MWCSALGGIVALLLNLLAMPLTATAQQPAPLPRIGYLSATPPAANAGRLEAFRQGLRALGYVEGQNIVIEYRYAEGQLERLPELAAELVRLQVALIVSGGPAATRAAQTATATLPIVMAFDTDPVGNGFVASLARPGGNITGLSALSPEISSKQLELRHELVPQLSRVAIFGNSTEPDNATLVREIERAAGALGVQLQYCDILAIKDIATAFRAAIEGRADAVLVLSNPMTNFQRKQMAALAIESRLPAIYWATEFVEVGGLMSYGVSFLDLYRRTATYVDKVLKGTKPADLPVEQPINFELAINVQAATQIGLTISPTLLFQADKVIR